ncbi:MAG: hypothetical protein GF409_08150 [Candidatus Omnitrophica bacterium]|nr:hypothetical protein [Candidatus Omnitrophota bacterium]
MRMRRIWAVTLSVIYLFIQAGVSYAGGFSRVMVLDVRSTEPEFSYRIKVEVNTYERLGIGDIYPAHVRKRTGSGLLDKLYISGTVEPLENVTLAGVVVVAEFLDSAGNTVALEESAVIPRILGLRGSRTGRFTVDTDYSESITTCKLSLRW